MNKEEIDLLEEFARLTPDWCDRVKWQNTFWLPKNPPENCPLCGIMPSKMHDLSLAVGKMLSERQRRLNK